MSRTRLVSFAAAAAAGLALMIATAASAQQAAPYVWITPPPGNIAAGQEFITTVHVSGADGVYGISFTIAYDPQMVEVVPVSDEAIQAGSFFAGQPAFTLRNSGSNGLIEYALTLTQPAEPITGEGVLGTITFRALSAGASTITPLEARLLVPVFSEVNGQRVAREINETPAQTQGLALAVAAADAPPPAVVADSQLQPAAVTPAPMRPNTLPVLLVGGLLFLTGLALFAMSIGGYVRLRRQFEAEEQPVW